MNTLIYTDGGNVCHGSQDLSNNEIKQFKQEEMNNGSIGYMVGHRIYGNEKERVIVFFNEEPKDIEQEEQRRRGNGFIGAKWYDL